MAQVSDILKRAWCANPGASQAELDELRGAVAVSLPESYLELLSLSNGGEGPLAAQPYLLILDEVAEVLATLRSGRVEEFFAGFVIIGSNGGGEYVALDTRGAEPWPVVALDMCNSDLVSSVLPIAPNFDVFAELVGVEAEESPNYPEFDAR